MFKNILARFKEPSSYAGIAAIAMSLGVSGAITQPVVYLLAGAAGLASVFLAEKTG